MPINVSTPEQIAEKQERTDKEIEERLPEIRKQIINFLKKYEGKGFDIYEIAHSCGISKHIDRNIVVEIALECFKNCECTCEGIYYERIFNQITYQRDYYFYYSSSEELKKEYETKYKRKKEEKIGEKRKKSKKIMGMVLVSAT